MYFNVHHSQRMSEISFFSSLRSRLSRGTKSQRVLLLLFALQQMKKWVVGKLHGTLPTTTMAQLCSSLIYHVDSRSITVSQPITINRGFGSCSISRKHVFLCSTNLGRWCARAACFALFWFMDKFLRSGCKRHQKNIPHVATPLLRLALLLSPLESPSLLNILNWRVVWGWFSYAGFTPSSTSVLKRLRIERFSNGG